MPHLRKKEKEFYVNKKSTHVRNKVIYSQQSCISIVEQVIYGDLKGEIGRKRQQFATILDLYNKVVLC